MTRLIRFDPLLPGNIGVGVKQGHVALQIYQGDSKFTIGLPPKAAIAFAESVIKWANTLPAEEERPNE